MFWVFHVCIIQMELTTSNKAYYVINYNVLFDTIIILDQHEVNEQNYSKVILDTNNSRST